MKKRVGDMASATPRPWRIDCAEGCESVIIVGANHGIAAVVRKADAELIVKAVNGEGEKCACDFPDAAPRPWRIESIWKQKAVMVKGSDGKRVATLHIDNAELIVKAVNDYEGHEGVAK